MIRLAALVLLGGATMAAQSLLERVRDKVLDNTRRVPRYTCTQTINRTENRPQYGGRGARCEGALSAGYITWHDRLRLDVAVVNGKETFSWAGAREFETTDIEQLTSSGSTGSGDFATFLTSVFGQGTTRISPTDLTGMFAFRVPVEQSRYRFRSHGNGEERTIGFHGSFLVDEAMADLKRLTVEADEFPSDEQVCRVQDVMDYHRVKIGDGDFLLPETATMNVLFKSGQESRNETRYSDCREYTAESSIRFGDDATVPDAPSTGRSAPQKLPPNLRLQIGLKAPIHSETAAAGDAVTAVLLRDVKGVARAGDVVHGRILRLEQFLFPAPRWVVAMRFDAIEHDGVERPFDARAVKGDGTFTFRERGNLLLDQKFHSEWETR